MNSLRFSSTPFWVCVFVVSMISLGFMACGGARVQKSTQDPVDLNLNELLEMSEEPVSDLRGGSPFLNSLISEFGDIPEVHTYYSHMETLHKMEDLGLDELIELLSATSVLFPSENTAEALTFFQEQRKLLKASGLNDFPNKSTYRIILNLTLGDSIKVIYPDGRIKESKRE